MNSLFSYRVDRQSLTLQPGCPSAHPCSRAKYAIFLETWLTRREIDQRPLDDVRALDSGRRLVAVAEEDGGHRDPRQLSPDCGAPTINPEGRHDRAICASVTVCSLGRRSAMLLYRLSSSSWSEGRDVRTEWVNQLGGVTFQLIGSFRVVPEIIGVGEDDAGARLATTGLHGEEPSVRPKQDPAIAAIRVGLRYLHEQAPTRTRPFSWSTNDRVISAHSRDVDGLNDPNGVA